MISSRINHPQQITENLKELNSSFTHEEKSIEPALKQIEINSSTFQRDSQHLHSLDYAFIKKDAASLQKIFQVSFENFKFSSNSKTNQAAKEIKKQSYFGSIEISHKSLIHECILTGRLDIVSHFLSSSKYIFDLNPIKGLTCMHLAALGDSIEMLDLLVLHNFSISASDQWGRTPLHYAALNPNKNILITLLRYNADILQEDNFGITALDLLNYESQSINPLNIQIDQYQTLTLLLMSLLADLSKKNGLLDNYPILSQISSYLTPASQFALILQNKTISFNKKIAAAAICLLAEQFTITKLALSTFLLAKTSLLAINSIQNTFNFTHLSPYDSLKNIIINGLQTALVTRQYFSTFTPDFFQNHFDEWSFSKHFKFETSQLGKQSQREWKNFTTHAKDTIEFLRNGFNQFKADYCKS